MSLLQRVAVALFNEYRLDGELGTGATATVYRAHDLLNERDVALKVLRPELALAVGGERFLREVHTVARLSHPGIMPLYSSGSSGGFLYFTMPLIAGESLRQRLEREQRLSVDESVRLTREVAAALAHAHAAGVVHRDIKPENLLLDAERVLVSDFGLALALEESDANRLTHTGITMGTPQYMSPEQAAGNGALDARSDEYSLACVLYEMLTGRTPFIGPTPQSILSQHVQQAPPPVRSLRRDVPREVAVALERALAKDPNERFATVAAFSDALVTPSRLHWLPSRRVRQRIARGAATVAVLAFVSAGAFMVYRASAPAPLRERDWVLVADFDGPAGDSTLSVAARELVTTALNQSRYISTMPRAQLAGSLRAAGMPDSTHVNIDLARELAYRSAVRAVVGGSVRATSTGYDVALRAVDASDGRELARLQRLTTADSLVPTLSVLGRELRAQLGEHRRDLAADQLLLDIATPSLPAYRRYVDALSRKQRGDVTGSTRVLREALALDSGFASAWALMGMNYVEARQLDSARIAFAAALANPERMDRVQRLRLQGDAAYVLDRDLEGAVRWYGEYVQGMPRSIGGHNNRGLYLSLLGKYEDALTEFEQAADNNPFGPDQSQPAIVNATDMLVALRQLDRAQAKSRALTGAYASFAKLRLANVANRWNEADSLARDVLASPSSSPALVLEATTTHAAALAAEGRSAEADAVLLQAARAATGARRTWYEQARTLQAITSEWSLDDSARAAAQGGNRAGASVRALNASVLPALVVRLGTVDSSIGAGTRVAIGMRAALRGDTSTARAIALSLRARDYARAASGQRDARPAPRSAVLVVEAMIDRQAKRWRLVIDSLAPLARAGEHDATDLERLPSITLRWLVADAYRQLGARDSAAAFVTSAMSFERVPPGHVALRGFVARPGAKALTTLRTASRE